MYKNFGYNIFLSICLLLVSTSVIHTLSAQQKSKKIQSILSNFKSYKYSDIYVYKLRPEIINVLNENNINKVNYPKWIKFFPESLEKYQSNTKDPKLGTELKSVFSSPDYLDSKFSELGYDKGPTLQSIKQLVSSSKQSMALKFVIMEDYREDASGSEEESDDDEEKTTEKDEDNLDPLTEYKKAEPSHFNFAKIFVNNKAEMIADAYVITDRSEKDANIIGMVVYKNSFFLRNSEAQIDFDQIEPEALGNLLSENISNNPSDVKIFTRAELRNLLIGEKKIKSDSYIIEILGQNGGENVTAKIQGVADGELDFLPNKFGVSMPVSEDSIQQYLRITEGQPFDYQNEHELTIGLFDVIRYRYFKEQKSVLSDEVDESGDPISSKKQINNHFLPVFGIELKYGLNEINYPSLWSERMTLNVMWQSNKLGIILPTNGWSQLSKDFFNIERRLTNAGIGLYGSFDLPIKLINQGGVFNFNGSYVFGDAKVNPINSIMMIPGRSFEGRDSAYSTSLNLSYLPRFHAQAHYSFAINVDKYTFFRFKLGATAFLMQRYADLEKNIGTDPQSGRDIIEKSNRKIDQYTYTDLNDLNRFDNNQIIAMSSIQASELIAGLSGRIEFMTNTEEQTVPWGGALQYFDGALSGDLWLQVPIIGFDRIKPKSNSDDEENSGDSSPKSISSFALSLRAQAQFFQTVFRDPRPWELQTVAIPSLQFLLNF